MSSYGSVVNIFAGKEILLPVSQASIDFLSEFYVWAGLSCTLLCRTVTENEGKFGIHFRLAISCSSHSAFRPHNHQSLDTFTKLRKATVSFVMSVRLSAWNVSAFIGRNLTKIDVWVFSRICEENSFFIKIGQECWVFYMRTKCTFLTISLLIIRRMRSVSEKGRTENKNTSSHSIFFPKIVPFMR